jgi:hypothetical protein
MVIIPRASGVIQPHTKLIYSCRRSRFVGICLNPTSHLHLHLHLLMMHLPRFCHKLNSALLFNPGFGFHPYFHP